MEVWILLLAGLVSGAALIAIARSIDYSEGDLLATGLLVAAAIYVGFAVLWGEDGWVRFEAVGVAIFSLIAFLARRFGILWIGAGWLLHIGWDYLFHMVGAGSHLVPEWYPPICIGFDLIVGLYIFWVVLRKRKPKSLLKKSQFD
ncbi:MAG: DUF6010 family protein [Saprospiraceae bacterium]